MISVPLYGMPSMYGDVSTRIVLVFHQPFGLWEIVAWDQHQRVGMYCDGSCRSIFIFFYINYLVSDSHDTSTERDFSHRRNAWQSYCRVPFSAKQIICVRSGYFFHRGKTCLILLLRNVFLLKYIKAVAVISTCLLKIVFFLDKSRAVA